MEGLDMALFKFSNNIMLNKKIDLYNKGNHVRDLPMVNDVVDQIYKLLKPSKKTILIRSTILLHLIQYR